MIDPILINVIGAAVFGAIGGAAGAVISSALSKRGLSPKIASTSMVVCCALGLGLSRLVTPAFAAYLQNGSADATIAASMAELEREVPAFAALRIHEPEAYEQFRDTISSGLARNIPFDQLVVDARATLSAVYQRKLPHLDETLILETATLVAEQGQVLAKASPDTCVAWLNGQGGDIAPHLPAELKQKELELLDRTIRSAPLGTADAATDDEFAARVPALLDAIAARTSLPIETVNAAMNGEGSSAEICLVQSGLIGAIAELPDGQGAPLLRLIFGTASTAE